VKPARADHFFALAKFGRREHLEKLLHRGEVYMNTAAYFWDLEGDGVRGDWMDGGDRLLFPDEVANIKVETPDGEYVYEREHLAGPVKLTLAWTASTNIYCMYAFTVPPRVPLVDERNFAFGDSFIFFNDTVAFLDRVERVLAATGRKYRTGLVNYADPEDLRGRRPGVFQKRPQFEYQSEFRIALYGLDATPASIMAPVCLELGNLEAISTGIQPLSRINELIRVGTVNRRNDG
jgi:hypothetical protein